MAGDLPPGRWSALLVGAWWPAQPDAPMAGVTYWRKAAQLKRNEANDLRNERSRLAVNQGRTADDLLERYWRGEQRLATIAHQCEIKSDQSEQVADTVNYLRDRLTEIAQSGNQQINQILAGKGPIEAKVAAVNAVIEQSNAMADHVGATAMSNIIDATQRVFDETIGGDAHTWLRDHGVSLDTPVAIAAVVLGAAALIVALTRPTNSGPATAAGTTAEPTYTAAETAAAHQKLCEVYKLAAQAVRIDTHGGDRALAGVATVNGALMLEQAVNTAPALTPADRIAALTLAHAYSRASAMASVFHRDDPEWRSTVDDVNVKDARMKAVCGGG
ncbi:putative transmembrane protein [Mycobacterium tuberculosis]|nr:putative transmembrane protein [Mycobacterium tuberculosis]